MAVAGSLIAPFVSVIINIIDTSKDEDTIRALSVDASSLKFWVCLKLVGSSAAEYNLPKKDYIEKPKQLVYIIFSI
jgi:hypothetical protein